MSHIHFQTLALWFLAFACFRGSAMAEDDVTRTGASQDANTYQMAPNVPSATGSPIQETAAVPAGEGDLGGKIPLTFDLKFQTIYDDNIYITHDHRVDDLYWAITPEINYKTAKLEDEPQNYFNFDYAPTFLEFLNHDNNNSINHNAVANYQADLGRLKLGADVSYITDHTPDIDFGGRVDSAYYSGRLFAKYDLTGRLTLDTSATTTLSRYQLGNDTNDYNGSAYLDYAYSPKTTIGFGTTSGYTNVAGPTNPSINYQQINGRASYEATEKLHFLGMAGASIREYSNNGTTVTPNLSLTASYTPTDSTELRLISGVRTVPSIVLDGQNYNDYTLGFTVRQRIAGNVYVSLACNYEHADYFSEGATTAPTGRSFDYFTERPSIEWDWNKYATFSLYYERQDNVTPSAFTPLEFSVNSVGLAATFAY